ncbi:hypothetical protein GCM10010329_83080 [Streptomyces spiroverticillatus]|uniref:Uncharacterized protein n=1 Tax=Streptomyces finlayi TaxID=67296 RepID=A0A918X8W1_9ACTN|nr:hypothetical protein [Streptomyces finlayi]GHA48035.1 hypothetical protein GCM10010329_83080 [Streptomyces spiroverticillatus]GHD18887.1 hypothetical protein GCM10010334_82140 [Streptomyces finlayi]
MVHDDRTPSTDIELARTPEPQVSMVFEDEVEMVLKRAREQEAAEITGLLMEPRRPNPRSAWRVLTTQAAAEQ